jgi:Flp pilus assembly protein TadD
MSAGEGQVVLAALLDPGQAHFGYVHAVGLHSAGRPDEALAALKTNLQQHPNDRESLSAALAFSREQGDMVAALEYAERLARLSPHDGSLAKLTEQLRLKQTR